MRCPTIVRPERRLVVSELSISWHNVSYKHQAQAGTRSVSQPTNGVNFKVQTQNSYPASLYGPAMQVTVKSKSGEEKSWTLPLALLIHHSGYFLRLRNFKEGEKAAVVLLDFEPDVFRFFVEFMYYGRYSFVDDLNHQNRVRDSAKAWVFGDYLDATEFKNFAMQNLHDIYFPPGNARPKVGIGADAISYCCRNTTTGSPLHNLYLKFTIRWFHDGDLIDYTSKSRTEWDTLWEEYPGFRNSLLYFLNQSEADRAGFMVNLDEFMEKLTIKDEPSNPDVQCIESTTSV